MDVIPSFVTFRDFKGGFTNGTSNLDYNKNIGFPLLKFYLPINTLMK
jgi:hypothetical protein